MADGAPAKCSAVSLDCPVGTHVDAPRHFVRDGIPILEWIDRTDVGAGEYELLVLPLKLAGAEAARARAVPGS
jgi:kynurenine formamidase